MNRIMENEFNANKSFDLISIAVLKFVCPSVLHRFGYAFLKIFTFYFFLVGKSTIYLLVYSLLNYSKLRAKPKYIKNKHCLHSLTVLTIIHFLEV